MRKNLLRLWPGFFYASQKVRSVPEILQKHCEGRKRSLRLPLLKGEPYRSRLLPSFTVVYQNFLHCTIAILPSFVNIQNYT
ncbi:hypothetical protein NtB2_01172 [Lactococcus termiticola]|uniref:Uncharacterized protein n=1 Tax=Lactococcus termiticola TaxID=2169526 RepID=A0A2R5HHY9_9LACT|nr:hypothetical protein NtB2_01172 [Lactococcus termiticola]